MIPLEASRELGDTRASRPAIVAQDASSSLTDGQRTEPSLEDIKTPTIPTLKTDDTTSDSHATLDNGIRPPERARFLRDPSGPDGRPRSTSESPFRLTMPTISPGQLAFSALQYLPVPTLVLSSLKTIVLANEAVGRMLGVVHDDLDEEDASVTLERLRGQTLSQIGIDMLQDGQPVWVTWENFLDTVVSEMGVRGAAKQQHRPGEGDDTPTVGASPSVQRRGSLGRPSKDAVVEVVISRKDIGKTTYDHRYRSKESEYQIFAKMIISVWELEDKQAYFTLTFTSTHSTPSSLAAGKKSIARPSILEAADKKTISTPSILASNPPSVASSRDSNSPSFYSPAAITMSASPFPPLGPPSVASRSSTPSILQKMIRMKDALLDNTQMPILAMWKDGSVVYPNKAARRLFRTGADFDSSVDGFDLLQNWDMWNEDFTEQLDVSEYPISILLRTETPFPSIRIGMMDERGDRLIYDVLGEAIRDDTTGEFLAGVVTGRDVTSMSREITEIKERDEERFRLICDTMPQAVWTATADGLHDFFNARWYNYTGLKPEQCLGVGWQVCFHPDDMPESVERWNRSLATGEPYTTEYRIRSKEGQWRWFLGRALPVRNKDTGDIERWFGTCTDVHETMETKLSANRTRQQLLSVIAHAHVTIFTLDVRRRVTMLEGALIWNSTDDIREDSRWYIGENVYTVFNRLTEHLAEGEQPHFLRPVEDCLDGKIAEDVVAEEHEINDRWYRTRFLPMHGKKTHEGIETSERCVEGVIGVIMDVTELRVQKHEAETRLKEKRMAVANEAAAKEATRLKSQFLANMSHEIRTPITGVLGMAELLGGMVLDDEQREYVENIYSSANSLLTVINDILDFSKVESGRLDIEEVQFSLSLIVNEVVRMLQFAVEKKNLDFISDIGDEIERDMVVIGDPGRVRQIITNLLTNSIKFTNQGHVRFSVSKEKETADSVEIKFVVEDTGIGIQEDVRKKLFQPFSQGDASTARRFGGTGLGLTICKNLLELMHGRISLESVVGNGTTAAFWIPFNKVHGRQEATLVQAGAIPDRLQSELSLSCNSSEHEQIIGNSTTSEGWQVPAQMPRRRSSARTPPNFEQEMPRSERQKVHILVVEDNPVNQKIAIKTIGKLGFNVTAAWNGREALEYLVGSSEGQNPKPDIILMDVQMPIIDGYKTTHLMRHHLPYKSLVQNVPIVAMTASAIQGDREKCTKAGMDDYLSKPVTMNILERMLIRWSTSKRRVRPSPAPSDCSEQSENCKNADIPHVGLERIEPLSGETPVTPRPLAHAGRPDEPMPFDSPAGADMRPQVHRPEDEKELTNKLQETKLIDAAGGPGSLRSNSYQGLSPGEALTEENMNKLKSENQQ